MTETRPRPLFSVITVCLNCEDTIGLTLESVSGQTYPRIEHVVIDGASKDRTAEIARAAGVAHLTSEPDRGIYDAMEKGVRAANGDYLIFLNSGDVFYDEGVCADTALFLEAAGYPRIVFGGFMPYVLDPETAYDHDCFTPGRICHTHEVRNRNVLRNQNIHHQSLFYHRVVFRQCSYFAPECPGGSDYFLNAWALAGAGFSARHMPRMVSKFLLGGVSTSNFGRELEDYERQRKIINARFFADGEQNAGVDEYVFRGVLPFAAPGATAAAPERKPPVKPLWWRVFKAAVLSPVYAFLFLFGLLNWLFLLPGAYMLHVLRRGGLHSGRLLRYDVSLDTLYTQNENLKADIDGLRRQVEALERRPDDPRAK
jgi:glycosyltransferase involved in cell wall biosynthesis